MLPFISFWTPFYVQGFLPKIINDDDISAPDRRLDWRLTCIPMQESFPPEHGSKWSSNPFEEFLNSSGVPNKRSRHGQSSWRDVTDSSLDIIRNPFHKVTAVLVLDVQELFIHLLHGHTSSEDDSYGEISSMTRITGGHHVLTLKHLLCELRDGKGSREPWT